MTNAQVQAALNEVRYRDWGFAFDDVRRALRVAFLRPDVLTGKHTLNHGRWWPISRFATKSELIQTCLLAVMTAEEHEIREHFLYKGARIFGPHFDVDQLVEICDDNHLDVRPEKPEIFTQLPEEAMNL